MHIFIQSSHGSIRHKCSTITDKYIKTSIWFQSLLDVANIIHNVLKWHYAISTTSSNSVLSSTMFSSTNGCLHAFTCSTTVFFLNNFLCHLCKFLLVKDRLYLSLRASLYRLGISRTMMPNSTTAHTPATITPIVLPFSASVIGINSPSTSYSVEKSPKPLSMYKLMCIYYSHFMH